MRSRHLVICGWKPQMETILLDILKANPNWTSNDIVVIAPVSNELVAKTHSIPLLKDILIIQEDVFNEVALLKAEITRATKAIVLATSLHAKESIQEIDGKTVIAAMSIEKLAPEVYLTVELMDPEFLPYLKMAHVDEVIYPQEYSRILLANSMHSAGISHVVFALLDVHSGVELTTLEIPPHFIGRSFNELWRFFYDHDDAKICVGILENNDNVMNLKKQALVEAQKSTDIRSVIKSLEFVKHIEANIPHINPPIDYTILPNSRAIVVTRREKLETELKAV